MTYKDHPKCEELVFPLNSNQKIDCIFDRDSYCLQDKKGFNFPSCQAYICYTRTLFNGVTINSVSKMLGHLDIRMTQLYAKTLELKIGNDMADLKKKRNI